jgi:hypothetical protein
MTCGLSKGVGVAVGGTVEVGEGVVGTRKMSRLVEGCGIGCSCGGTFSTLTALPMRSRGAWLVRCRACCVVGTRVLICGWQNTFFGCSTGPFPLACTRTAFEGRVSDDGNLGMCVGERERERERKKERKKERERERHTFPYPPRYRLRHFQGLHAVPYSPLVEELGSKRRRRCLVEVVLGARSRTRAHTYTHAYRA